MPNHTVATENRGTTLMAAAPSTTSRSTKCPPPFLRCLRLCRLLRILSPGAILNLSNRGEYSTA